MYPEDARFQRPVSIHAPVKGATKSGGEQKENVASFNSRTRKGCDVPPAPLFRIHRVSIHAPVKGATFITSS